MEAVNNTHMDEIKILQKLIEHDEHLDRIEEKMATMVTLDAFNNRMDKAMTILERLDQERIFSQEWIRRVEGEVERHTQEIKQLKQHLNIT